jgi:DNA-binding GntR family transcriptional regulator
MVTPISIRDLQEVFHLRSVLEVEAINLAVENITDEDIQFLEKNNQIETTLFAKSNQNGTSEDYIHAYKLNLEFHLRIAAASGNKRLAKLIEELLNEMERILARDPYIAYPKQHVAIIKALKNRDKKASKQAMIEHIENTKSRLLDRF